MKGTDSIINSKLLHLVLFVISSQLIKPSPFTSFHCGVHSSVLTNFVFMKVP